MRSLNPKIYSKDYYLNACLGYEEFKQYKGKKVHQQIVDFCNLLKIKKGIKILDLGCGRGDLAIECARRGAVVTGIDYSKDGITLAKESLKNQSLLIQQNVKFLVMDAKKLKFSDNTFDIVTSVDVFEHLYHEELEVVMRELSRVLKKNGKLIIHTAPNKIYLDYVHKLWTYPMNILLIKINKLVTKKDYPSLPKDSRNDLHKQQHVNEPTYFYLKQIFRNNNFKGTIISIVPYKPLYSWKDRLYNIFVWLYPFSKYFPIKILFTTDYICIMKNTKKEL